MKTFRSSNNSSPRQRTCGTMSAHHTLLDRHPEYRENLVDIERYTARFQLLGLAGRRTGVSRIQTVVHVVHREEAENVSDVQIRSQIDVLNRDYRARNPDVSRVPDCWRELVSDASIEFVLASVDPNGAASSGITRTKTTAPSFSQNDTVKSSATGGVDPWPTDRYLNIWVCTLRGGLLGYAQFPGGPEDTDGVVILNTAFGTVGTATPPFHLGRTATHEVGHWLNLRHIWGDRLDCSGTDEVDDTPPARQANHGTPTFPHVSCKNAPNGDMFMNYMDYVDDEAMFMFTGGQVARMAATLDGPRASLFADEGARVQIAREAVNATLAPELFDKRWFHAFEEDTPNEQVFRPEGFALPRARGRRGFELKHDGRYVDLDIAPGDGTTENAGKWIATDGKTIEMKTGVNPSARRIVVSSLAPDRLVLAKNGA